MQNLLGYIPAPFIYGAINDYQEHYPRLALTIGIYWSVFGLLGISIATIIRFRKDKLEDCQNMRENLIQSINNTNEKKAEKSEQKLSLENTTTNLNNVFRQSLANNLIVQEIEKEKNLEIIDDDSEIGYEDKGHMSQVDENVDEEKDSEMDVSNLKTKSEYNVEISFNNSSKNENKDSDNQNMKNGIILKNLSVDNEENLGENKENYLSNNENDIDHKNYDNNLENQENEQNEIV